MSGRESTTDLHPLFSGTQVALEDQLMQAGYLKEGESLTITREGPEGWQRARCPKCNYMRAQVHPGLGYFWCPKVRTWTDENGSHVEPCLRVNIPRESPVFQFSDLIVKVVGSASVRKYGDWFPGYEAAQVCEELLVRYVLAGLIDRLKAGLMGQAEAGLIDAESVPDKLRGYLYTELHGDVRDHAKAKVRRLRRQRDAEQKAIRPDGGPALLGTGRIQGPDEGPWNAERRRQDALDAPGKPREKWGGSAFSPTGRLRVADADYLVDIDSEYPLLTMAKLWGMSQAEIARALKVTTRTVRTRMKAERERLEASARARSLIS